MNVNLNGNIPGLRKTYRDIFNERGLLYHKAMVEVPEARCCEFEYVIAMTDLANGYALCDAPSGGAYLADFIKSKDISCHAVETSEIFAREALKRPRVQTILCKDLRAIPLADAMFDAAISLAGVHHLESKPLFYKEIRRLLKSEGIFGLADVMQGSNVDHFLNEFVDRHCSMGHNGAFLNETTLAELEASGFDIESAEEKNYHWYFESATQMGRYCKQLFGLDRANEAEVVEGIKDYLGYEDDSGTCRMNWGLYFIRARRS